MKKFAFNNHNSLISDSDSNDNSDENNEETDLDEFDR